MESQTPSPAELLSPSQFPPQYYNGMHPPYVTMVPGPGMEAAWQQQAMAGGDSWPQYYQPSAFPGCMMMWNQYPGQVVMIPDQSGEKPHFASDTACETADTATIEPEAEPHQLATPSTKEGSLTAEARELPEQEDDLADFPAWHNQAGAISRRGRGNRRRRDRRPETSPVSGRWSQDASEQHSYPAAGAAAATASWGSFQKKKGSHGGRGWSNWDEGNSTWASNGGKRSKDGRCSRPQCPLHIGCCHTVADLYTNTELCQEAQKILDGSDRLLNESILEWVFTELKKLAMNSTTTSLLVQKLVSAVTTQAALRLAGEIIPFMEELYPSPHGNYVITKVIECVPDVLEFRVIDRIQSIGPLRLARHRFGCRILERLVEHCSREEEILPLANVYTEHAAELCRHQYGNFVVQHLLEHGSPSLKSSIVEKMLPTVQDLATHRTASHVVQKALEYSDADKAAIRTGVLGDDDDKFREVACSRFGGYVVEELLKLELGREEVRAKLSSQALNEEQKVTPAYIRMKEANLLQD